MRDFKKLFNTVISNGFFDQAERALRLWAVGALTVKNVRKAQATKKRAIKIVPKVNSRGEETTGFSAFSAKHWSTPTRQYLVSINDLSDQEMRNIIAASRPFAGRISTIGGDDSDSNDEDDPRCKLVRRLVPLSEDEEW